MAFRKITADIIFDGNQFHQDQMLILSGDKIESIAPLTDDSDVERLVGILTPGFINTHCHLELSHLKGRIHTGTGLLAFIEQVVSLRAVDQSIINQAIEDADLFMWNHGIQAVGDISNQIDTIETKRRSKIHYHTFLEMFDFMQEALTHKSFQQYASVFSEFKSHGLAVSTVPHAPYSVSPGLFSLIRTLQDDDSIVSIHNQETEAENQFFQSNSGGFLDFYQKLGLAPVSFLPTGKNSIDYAIEHMNATCKTLFVHNTMTSKADIEAAHEWNPAVYWATCARANLFIENQLPNYQNFIDLDAKMTIGTDSLTSNWQLCIWKEIKTIHQFNNYIPLGILLQWATKNGAELLGVEETLGTFEKGKEPGVVLLENATLDDFQKSKARRII